MKLNRNSHHQQDHVLVVAPKESDWVSCKTIRQNLEAAHKKAFPDINIHVIEFSGQVSEGWLVAQKIHQINPDSISFIDHAPHPEILLRALDLFYSSQSLPKFYFHLYGDFTLYSAPWLACEGILKKTHCVFFAASDRQAKLVSNFMLDGNQFVRKCHFPVDTDVYRFKAGFREEWRKKLRIETDEVAFVYTGRLSQQKNISRMYHEILRHFIVFRKPFRLFVAGSYDDIGSPFFGLSTGSASYYEYLNNLTSLLPQDFTSRVRYLGNLKTSELQGLYSAGDIYLSLSLHHDEDFGMSPAEALCCGCAGLLSDWGGFASFADPNGWCQLVPVRIGKTNLEISTSGFQKKVVELTELSQQPHDRATRSQYFCNRFSLDAAVQLIRTTFAQNDYLFSGFNWKMREYDRLFRENQRKPYPQGPRSDSFYKEVYGNYINSEE